MKETQTMIDIGVLVVELRNTHDIVDQIIEKAPVAIDEAEKGTGMYKHDFSGSLGALHRLKAALYEFDSEHPKITKKLKKNSVTMASDTEFKKNQAASRAGGGPSR